MGIQINGQTDTISASDGGLAVSGYELTGPSNINVTGIVTATTLHATNIKHPSFGSDTFVLDSSGNINIDSGGVYYDATNNRFGIGTTSPDTNLEVALSGSSANGLLLSSDNIDTSARLFFQNGTAGEGYAILQENGGLDFRSGATAGSTSGTQRVRFDGSGNALFGTTTNGTTAKGIVLRETGELLNSRSGGPPLLVNRLTNDGDLVDFRGQNSSQGSISVSGTTVSYNGGHLTRWSQLPGGAERTEILRGSVLSNIDEMCEWGEEDNEQLNRMQVSDVEGDKNVAGVFQAWDDDDDTYTNDFYCAMTGDFVIRIAEGVTVERGDLLMSAGDGTAKPQDDDIIRSKTIAKVTSTNVSCTYDDGSYCVPCVLMAC